MKNKGKSFDPNDTLEIESEWDEEDGIYIFKEMPPPPPLPHRPMTKREWYSALIATAIVVVGFIIACMLPEHPNSGGF